MMKKINIYDLVVVINYLLSSLIFIITLNLIVNKTLYKSIPTIIMGMIFSFIILLIFNKILNTKEDKDVFNKLSFLPSFLSSFINIFLVVTTFIYAIFLVINISKFISLVYLPNINIYYITITFLIPTIYLCIKGIDTFFRTSTLIFYIYFILNILTFIFLLPYLNIINILPIEVSFNNIITSLGYTIITSTPILLLLIVPKNYIRNNNKTNKQLLIGVILSSIFIFIKIIFTIAILNYNYTKIITFPNIAIYKEITVLNFLERLEIILAISQILELFLSLSLSFIYIKTSLITTLKIKKDMNKTYSYLIGIITFLGSIILVNLDHLFIIYNFIIFILIHLFIIIVTKINNVLVK